jgi:MFS family permease
MSQTAGPRPRQPHLPHLPHLAQLAHLPHPHLPGFPPHGLVTFPGRVLPWIEPWFLAYACLGVVQGGMLPLLLPLSAGGLAHAGIIVGAMNLAGLAAPFFGHLADRRRLHRTVLLGGLLTVLVALLCMPAPLPPPLKALAAGVLGLGFAAANTVANMFIVEVRPAEEWDARIGALQALTGAGQVAGLLVAGFIGGRYALAFGVAAALVAAAVPIAWATLRGIQVPMRDSRMPRAEVAAHPALGGEGWISAPQRLFHLLSWRGLRAQWLTMETPFARLLLLWFAAFVAISAALTMFPLSVITVFGVHQRLPATVYAFAAGVSLLLYPLAAAMARRHGPRRVLRTGFLLRTVAVCILAAAFLAPQGGVVPVLAGFVVLVIAWPLLGVSGTALAATLAPGEKGDALGLFNAASSLAGAAGAFLGGWATATYGYGAVCAAAALVLAAVAAASGGGDRGQPSPPAAATR